ncbi:MAG: hypothetical protein AMXMBFR64_32610 [Myxococcales bacterium]
MLLAYNPALVAALRTPTTEAPWRVLASGCLASWPCGVDGHDYGLGRALADLFALPTLRIFPFCPEQHALGTPRTMPDIHGGDGFDVLAGRARVLDQQGADLTAAMVAGAHAMVDFARAHDVELAILTDMSAACGSQVISEGCRLVAERRFQKGVGVATAALLSAGVCVVSQRDFKTLAALRSRLDPTFVVAPEVYDHHEHPWTREHLPAPHPRSSA